MLTHLILPIQGDYHMVIFRTIQVNLEFKFVNGTNNASSNKAYVSNKTNVDCVSYSYYTCSYYCTTVISSNCCISTGTNWSFYLEITSFGSRSSSFSGCCTTTTCFQGSTTTSSQYTLIWTNPSLHQYNLFTTWPTFNCWETITVKSTTVVPTTTTVYSTTVSASISTTLIPSIPTPILTCPIGSTRFWTISSLPRSWSTRLCRLWTTTNSTWLSTTPYAGFVQQKPYQGQQMQMPYVSMQRPISQEIPSYLGYAQLDLN